MQRLSVHKKHLILILSLILLATMIVLIDRQRVQPKTPPLWHWRGIVPGETTYQQVIEIMGLPDNVIECEKWGWRLDNPYEFYLGSFIRPCVLAPLMYEYEQARAPDKQPGLHQLYFREGKVWLIVEDTRAYPTGSAISAGRIIEKYGEPEAEAWHLYRWIRHLVYCEQGVIFATNDYEALRIFHFEPMPLLPCLGEFEYYLTLKPPPDVIIN